MLLRSKNIIVTLSWAFVVIFFISSFSVFGEPEAGAGTEDAAISEAAGASDDEAMTENVAATEDETATGDVATSGDVSVTEGVATSGDVPATEDEAVTGDVAASGDMPATEDEAVTGDVAPSEDMPATEDEAVTGDVAPSEDMPVTEDEAVTGDAPGSIDNVSATEDTAVNGNITVKQEAGLFYTVKKGDTLWDISQHFFDSPWLWPDLWSENSQIHNPHLIYPGDRIRIFQKGGGIHIVEAPKEEEKAVEPEIAKEEPVEEVAVTEEPKEEEPVTEEPKIEEQEEIKDLPSFPYVNIDSIGFVRKEVAQSYGYIAKAKEDIKILSKGDIVYIKQKEEGETQLIPGSLYAVFRVREESVKDPETKEYIGIQHDLKGVVEVVEILNESPFIAEGKIVKSFRHIAPGDLLMPYKRRAPLMGMKKSPEGLTGKIILSEDHGKIFGENTLVFVDVGSQDGVMPGQEYNVFYNENLGKGFSKSINIGQLLVLHTEDSTSTAIILRTIRQLEPGMEIKSAKY